jgi:hypothetical protein
VGVCESRNECSSQTLMELTRWEELGQWSRRPPAHGSCRAHGVNSGARRQRKFSMSMMSLLL